MTAPRPAVVVPRRARDTGSAPRPHLRVVGAQPRRARVRLVLTLSTVVVFAVLLLAAAVHTTMVSGQRRLDRVDSRLVEADRQNQGLRLEVARLQSPARIVEAASAEGMVVPEDVTWLSPEEVGPGAAVAPEAPAAPPDPVDDQRAAPGSADAEPGAGRG